MPYVYVMFEGFCDDDELRGVYATEEAAINAVRICVNNKPFYDFVNDPSYNEITIVVCERHYRCFTIKRCPVER